MDEIQAWVTWLRTQLTARAHARDERGFTAVEWLIIALGVITIATVAVAAVQNYVTGQTNKLGSP